MSSKHRPHSTPFGNSTKLYVSVLISAPNLWTNDLLPPSPWPILSLGPRLESLPSLMGPRASAVKFCMPCVFPVTLVIAARYRLVHALFWLHCDLCAVALPVLRLFKASLFFCAGCSWRVGARLVHPASAWYRESWLSDDFPVRERGSEWTNIGALQPVCSGILISSFYVKIVYLRCALKVCVFADDLGNCS